MWAHVTAAATLVVAIALAVLPRGESDVVLGVHPNLWLGITELVLFQSLSAALYSDFALPTLVCVTAFGASFHSQTSLADYRYTVALPGAIAGAVYAAIDFWWRHGAAGLSSSAASSPELRHARRALYEIGWRYLAAWFLVLLVDALSPVLGVQFSDTEHVVAEAGGVIVFIDLIALGTTRFGEARRALSDARREDSRRYRPQPHRRLPGRPATTCG